MKGLLVSDLHYTLKQYDWVHAVAENFDVVVIAGDHLDIASLVALDAQIVVILKYIDRLKSRTRLVVSSGNHDLNARDASGEKVAKWMARVRSLGVICDGDTLRLDDAPITVCPWWDGPLARADIERQFSADAQTRNGQWIWVYHAPPDESPVSWSGQRHFGDRDLNAWIANYQPDMVFTGHIHQSPFRQGGAWADRIGSTWVFNAGRQIGPVPTHIIIDTNERNAVWFSMEGSDTISLDAPLPSRAAPL